MKVTEYLSLYHSKIIILNENVGIQIITYNLDSYNGVQHLTVQQNLYLSNLPNEGCR